MEIDENSAAKRHESTRNIRQFTCLIGVISKGGGGGEREDSGPDSLAESKTRTAAA